MGSVTSVGYLFCPPCQRAQILLLGPMPLGGCGSISERAQGSPAGLSRSAPAPPVFRAHQPAPGRPKRGCGCSLSVLLCAGQWLRVAESCTDPRTGQPLALGAAPCLWGSPLPVSTTRGTPPRPRPLSLPAIAQSHYPPYPTCGAPAALRTPPSTVLPSPWRRSTACGPCAPWTVSVGAMTLPPFQGRCEGRRQA